MTESSVNLGKVAFDAKTGGTFSAFPRSSINSFLPNASDHLAAICRVAGFEYSGQQNAFGGWAPVSRGELLKSAVRNYAEVLGIAQD